jgi:RNA polymerase sigma-70 factor (ECF subfamily)
MERAQKGDREAFHSLFKEIGPPITGFLRRRLFDLSEVEDVCQETLLAIYESRHSYQPTRPIEPWLFAIAKNVSAEHIRCHRSRARWQKQVDEMPEAVAEDEVGLTLDLRRALSHLTQSQLEALTMTKIDGLSLAEASERTGASVVSLKVRVHRAYKLLRKALVP